MNPELTIEDVQQLKAEAGGAITDVILRAIIAERQVRELKAEVAKLEAQLPKDEDPEDKQPSKTSSDSKRKATSNGRG